MLTPHVLIEIVTAEPFQPFRLHMASGRTFDVRHPEMIQVGRSFATVYGKPEDGAAPGELWQRVSLMLLESVEPLEVASPLAGSSPLERR